MKFGSPHFFWFLFLLPVLVGFFIWAHQQRQTALKRFASLDLIRRLTPGFNRSRIFLRWAFFLAFSFFLILALTRPRFGLKSEIVERKGVDVLVALDISQSMLAQDIAPSRIERAKSEIARFLDMLKGDRVGLIIFAGESYALCPLTLDYGAALMFLQPVETDWIQMQGTAIADAITKSIKAFNAKEKKNRVLVILSDGEDQTGDPVAAAKEAATHGIRIYSIGIGSESGVPIPVAGSGGNVVYKKDNSGNLVMTRLNPVMLEKVAIETGGKYFHAGTDLELTSILDEIAKMEKSDLGANQVSIYEEKYQIFLFIALIFLLLEFFIPERVRRKDEWQGRFSGAEK